MTFRKTFKPTLDEQLENHLKYYTLCLDLYKNEDCSTCKHSEIKDTWHWNGLKDFYIKCNLDNNTLEKCVMYECSDNLKKDAFNRIKNFILENYDKSYSVNNPS